MRCADCPDIDNGTRKRPICCLRAGAAARRAKAEADIIGRLPPAEPKISVRNLALGGTLLGSAISDGFHPSTWRAGRYAAPLTPEEETISKTARAAR